MCGRYRRLDLQCASLQCVELQSSACRALEVQCLVWAPVCGTYLRCRTLEVQCVVWAPVCGAMSSVPRTGGPVCGVAVANKTIRAALSSPSLSQPPRACSLLPRPMLECAHAIRASEGAHNFCVFGHKLLQAAWPGKQGAGSARNTGALSAMLMVGCAWWMLGMKRCPRERRWVRLLRACAPPGTGGPHLASKHLPSPASRERAAAGGGRAFASFASGKEQRISLSIA